MKRAIIVHGWEGFPEEAWFPWLKSELEKRGFEVHVPAMPDASVPVIEKWVPKLAEVVGTPDEETYFIGHSVGVQTILRYLESIDVHVGGVLSVVGWFTLIPESLEDEESKKIAEPWLTRPIDDEKVKRNAGSVSAIFSDNDPFVGLENKEMFEKRLGAETAVLHGKGHLGYSEGYTEVPEVLNAFLKLAGE